MRKETEIKKLQKLVQGNQKDSFFQGYACAVANMIRLNGEVDVRTYELARDGGLTKASCKRHNVDVSDMEIFEKYDWFKR